MSGEKPESARQVRLRAALRENLKRRKARARGREDAARVPEPDQEPQRPTGRGKPVDDAGD
jgi:hypothetical protein